MSTDHLVPATKIQAFYSPERRTLTVSAEVTFGPGDYGIQIYRSMIDPTGGKTPVFVIAAPAPKGVQPQYIFTTRISESFACDAPPKTIVVYSEGVDGPLRTEVPVGDAPVTPVASPAASAAAPASTAAVKEATGWSITYDFSEALADAITKLSAAVGVENPDVGLHAVVVATGVQVGGFTANRGLFITLKAG